MRLKKLEPKSENAESKREINMNWMLHALWSAKYLNEMAGATGLEPAASGVTGRRSNQLSYAPIFGSAADLNAPLRQVKARTTKRVRHCLSDPVQSLILAAA
jgi:hypothetical protein